MLPQVAVSAGLQTFWRGSGRLWLEAWAVRYRVVECRSIYVWKSMLGAAWGSRSCHGESAEAATGALTISKASSRMK